MNDIKKLSKGKQQLKEIIKQAPQRCHIDEKDGINDSNFERVSLCFIQILNYVSKEAGIDPPTKEEAHELFDEFNDKNSTDNLLTKDEFNNFIEKVLEMLNASVQAD